MTPYYNIICGIDNNYVEQCATMLNSLFHNSPNSQFKIFILSLDISLHNKNTLSNWILSQNNLVNFIDIKQEQILNCPIKKDDTISAATYLRLLIPQVIPNDIEKALYLDVDLIVSGDIAELFSIDISSYAACAVEDAPNDSFIPEYAKLSNYFNAGVLLLNLKTLRAQKFTDKALDFIFQNTNLLKFHDQDIINAVLKNQILPLPLKWNLLDCFYNDCPKIQDERITELNSALKNPGIIHFSGAVKPWHAGCSHKLAHLYKKNKPKLKLYLKPRKWERLNTFPRYQQFLLILHCPKPIIKVIDRIISHVWNQFEH